MGSEMAESDGARLLVADAGRPALPALFDDPYPALFALVRLVVELSGIDATGRAVTTGEFRL